MAHRNRWFTVLKNGWIFPWQTVSHNQMVVWVAKPPHNSPQNSDCELLGDVYWCLQPPRPFGGSVAIQRFLARGDQVDSRDSRWIIAGGSIPNSALVTLSNRFTTFFKVLITMVTSQTANHELYESPPIIEDNYKVFVVFIALDEHMWGIHKFPWKVNFNIYIFRDV